MIHQFQYPKVTPVRPGTSGTGSKPAGASSSGSRPSA